MDVGIASPDAAGAGTDPTEAMRLRKHKRYEPYIDVLERQNLTYLPLTWSGYGRPHPTTTSYLRNLAQ